MRGTEAVAAHITIFDAPGVLVLISRIRTLEAERDALRAAVKEAEGALEPFEAVCGNIPDGLADHVIVRLEYVTSSGRPKRFGLIKIGDLRATKLRSLPPADGAA